MSDQAAPVETIWLPAGTVFKVDGIPVRLVGETAVQTHPGNLKLMSPQVVAANTHLLNKTEAADES